MSPTCRSVTADFQMLLLSTWPLAHRRRALGKEGLIERRELHNRERLAQKLGEVASAGQSHLFKLLVRVVDSMEAMTVYTPTRDRSGRHICQSELSSHSRNTLTTIRKWCKPAVLRNNFN